MSAQEHVCVSITCDGCESDFGSDEFDSMHFDELVKAENHALEFDWTIEDGKHFCESCSEDRRMDAGDKKYPFAWLARAALIEKIGTELRPYREFLDLTAQITPSRMEAVRLIDKMLAEETLERVGDDVRIVLGGR